MKNKTNFLGLPLLFMVVFLFFASNHATAQRGKTTALLTNKLGVETQLEVRSVRYGETLPERLCPRGYFLLEIGEGCHVAIPPSVFKEARFEDTKHTITLSSGRKMTGKLMGELDGQVDYGNGKQPRNYDLSSVTLLTLQIANGTRPSPKTKKKPQTKWQITHSNPNVSGYKLLKPEFGFVYSHRYREKVRVDAFHYVNEWRTSTREKRTPTFVIDVAGEKIPATISDFAEVKLKPGKETEIELLSATSGVKTAGKLILKSDKNLARDWALVAEIEGEDGALLILSSPQCSIKKTAEQPH